MPAPVPAKVKLEHIYLKQISFESIPSYSLKGKERPIEVAVRVDVKKPENLRYITVCLITVNKSLKEAPFRIRLECEVISSVQSTEDIQILKDFANVGATFNAIVFAR